ncbi:hypothetical protein [Nocardia sp. MDA0666]|uniref:hypothetical protein n=1 Tax=Nocardia sp. MDA0666 TaxID=2135448 RepID=UPI0018EC460C|nr:hypothetical protein [Nocardia sp. MDA0666]
MTMKVVALRSIPIAGWLFLLAGPAVRGSGRRWLRTLWWIDAVLSIGVHAAQIPVAVRAARGSGRSRLYTAVMTQLFGLTWWRTETVRSTASFEENQR